MAERSRARSLAGREIGPLPAIADPRRRRRAKNDLEFFLKTYFPKVFSKPFGHNHKTLIESLQRCLVKGGRQAVAMPRGSGKTSISTYSAIWAAVNGYRRMVLIFAATQAAARKILARIHRALRRPGSLLAADYPEICFPFAELGGSALLARGQICAGEPTLISVSADRLVFPTVRGSGASGTVLGAVGVTGSFLGENADLPDGRNVRPDFLLLDDLQKDDLAKNPARVEELENKINASLEGLVELGNELSMVMTCTVKQPDDLSDRYLDHEKYPRWNGIRGKMIETFPDRMDLWREYRSRRHNSEEDARNFYLENREEMQRGAVVGWEECHNPEIFIDALEMSMDRWADNERAFWSEYQNEPLRDAGAAVVVPARIIMGRINGLERGIFPEGTNKITAFIDVHDDILYFLAAAFDSDGTGFVLDYGTYPEQKRRFFSKSDGGLETLRRRFGGTPDYALSQGLETLFLMLDERTYSDESGKERKIDRILVDAKYKPEIVESAIERSRVTRIIPARGHAVRATGRPMAEWQKKPGRRFGFHYLEEKVENRKFRSFLSDTNFWKTRVHEKLALLPTEKGSLTFWGNDKERHRMIAEHCSAEKCQLVSSGTHEVNQWTEKPTRPDNHLFDCLVGSLLAAETLGKKS